MKSSIYISPEKIEVLGYLKTGQMVTAKDYLTYPLPEECIINGKIIDAGPVTEGLNLLKGKKPELFKDLSLIMDGSFIFTKKITVPGKLKKKQYDGVIRDEFAEVAGDHENMICDHYMLETAADQSKSILACAVESEHLENYLSILKSAGIKPSAVRIGLLAVLRYISGDPELMDMTFVLNIVDGDTMLSMTFQRGVNTFLSRTRLYGEDHEAMILNTLDGLSGFIQFNKSQNFDDITHCFYLGLNESDMNLVELHSSYNNIQLKPLNIYKNARGGASLPAEAHFAYLDALSNDSAYDLVRGVKALNKAKKKSRPRKWWIPALIAFAILLAAPAGYLAKQISDTEKGIAGINDYLSSTNIAERSAELEIIMAETSRIRNIINQAEKREMADHKLPRATVPLMEAIVHHGANTVINNFEFSEENGIIRVSGASPTENDAAKYVELLKTNDLIEDIYYTGYSYDSQGRYNFSANIKIRIAEREKGE